MESMIKIDNGVSKKAMDEVADVAERLFKAAHEYEVADKNLGISLKLLGKTIKSGQVNISNCNLHNTEGTQLGEGSTAVHYRSCPEPSGTPKPELDKNDLSNKILELSKLSHDAGFVFDNIPREGRVKIRAVDSSVVAYVDYEKLQDTPYDEISRWLPKRS